MMYLSKKWLEEKDARLETIPSIFEKSVAKYQKTLFNDVLKLLDLFERDSYGKIIFNSQNVKNLSVAEVIAAKLKETLLSGDYVRSVDQFAQEFDKQAIITDKYYKAEFSNFKESAAADAALASAKKSAVEALIGNPIDSGFILPIKQVLEDSVSSNALWGETVQNIRNFVEGNEEADGRLLRYAKQIAKDEFSIADRSYTNVISEELDVEFYIWSGQDLPTTRCFCLERANKYFHYKEIESWGRGENLGECNNGDGTWAGERSGTNEQTIFQYAGGYNCGHSVMPLSVFNVPKEVVKRAIDNGYYQPSEKELELLGL